MRFEDREDRRVVAGSHITLHRTCGRARGQCRARKDIIEAPADVALAQVAPGSPPREQSVVVRIESAPDVHQTTADDALQQRALLGKLSNRADLALLWADISIRSRDLR